MNRRRRFLELLVLGGCAFVLSKALLSFALPSEVPPVEGNAQWRLILTGCYLGVATVLLPWYRQTILVLRRNWSLVALVLLALLSSLWAEIPDLVLRKSIGPLGTTFLGIALAVCFSFQDQLRLLSWIFRIIAVLSLVFIVLIPSYGLSQQGELRGIFEYKNALGSMMALSVLVEWQRAAMTRIATVFKIAAVLLSAVLLVVSNSITPMVALVGALLLMEIYKLGALRLRIPLYAIFVAASILVATGAAMLAATSDTVTGVVGRSSNLTGRTEIWGLVLPYISQRPVLGYGYSGFWLGASKESMAIDHIMRGWVTYAHNGYLEMQLTLGAVGLLLTLVFLGIGMKRALSFSKHRQTFAALWPLAFQFYFIVHNLGECTILIQDLEWAICVSCVVGTNPMLLSFYAPQDDELALIPQGEPA